MEFYPTSFEIDEDTRKIHTSLQGKKLSLQDVHVNLRGFHTKPTGACKRMHLPAVTLKRSGDGFDIEWDGPIDDIVSIVVEAQGGGGQTKRAELFLHPTHIEQETAVTEPARVQQTPLEKYKLMVQAGLTPADALQTIEDKLGEDVAAEVKNAIAKDIV